MMQNTIFLVLWCTLTIVRTSSGAHGPACKRQSNKTLKEVVECMQSGYDKVQRADTGNEPLKVQVDLVIISFGHLNDINMDFELEFYLRQSWVDSLLRYSNSSLPSNASYAVLDQALIAQIWRPDTYIENLKSLKFASSNGPFINQGLRLFPDGRVLISARISATLYCAMDFHSFPMDHQSCPITLSSYFFTESDLYFDWNEISVPKVGELAQFDMLGVKKDRASLKFSSGFYSSLKATFAFRRRLQNFMLGFYIPTILTVMLSWLSFFISPNSAPARCALGIITVLAVGGFLTSQRKSFPTVSYVMAADQYILTCYIFVFCALLEYAVVHYLFVYDKHIRQHLQEQAKRERNDEEKVSIDEGELNEVQEEEEEEKVKIKDGQEKPRLHPSSTIIEPFSNKIAPREGEKRSRGVSQALLLALLCPVMQLVRCYLGVKQKALVIDKFARVLFPLSFGIFNLIYWCLYLG